MARRKRNNHEGTWWQEGNLHVVEVMIDGQTYRKKSKDKHVLKAWLLDLQTKKAKGLPLAEARDTVGAFLQLWLETEIQPPRRSPNTYRNYRIIIAKHLTPTLGRTRLSDLTREQVQQLINQKLNERTDDGTPRYQPRNVARIHECLRTALNYAVATDRLGRNVAANVRVPGLEPYHVAGLSLKATQAVIAAIKAHRLGPLFLFQLAIGCRLGEALGLPWHAVDLDGGTVRLAQQLQLLEGGGWEIRQTKTHNQRLVNLPPQLVDLLRTWRRRQLEERLRAGELWQETGLVFTTQTGNAMNRHNVRRVFQRLLTQAGLERLRPHDLRHAAASLLLTGAGGADPVPLFEVSKILGHANIQTTANTYGHLLPEGRERAARTMAAVLGEAVG